MTEKRRAIDKRPYWQQVKEAAKALNGDGCTSAPDFFYRQCCDEHDVHYRTGHTTQGVPISRLTSDGRLFACMRKRGKTPILGTVIVPVLYWSAVRLFAWGAWKGGR